MSKTKANKIRASDNAKARVLSVVQDVDEDDKSRVYSLDQAPSPYLSQRSLKSFKKQIVVGEDLPHNSAFCIDLETKTH